MPGRNWRKKKLHFECASWARGHSAAKPPEVAKMTVDSAGANDAALQKPTDASVPELDDHDFV